MAKTIDLKARETQTFYFKNYDEDYLLGSIEFVGWVHSYVCNHKWDVKGTLFLGYPARYLGT